ncbi:hypothetical protein Tco_0946608 [Tanacetum coccineum]
MAQPQRPTDVHQDELCPPNKRYALMDANKKLDLENPLCPDESRILADILKNHHLRFSIVASSSVSWIYLGQLWHTLHEDGSKNTLKFMLDRKELTLTLDDFRTIFHLPQATNNNHDHFIPALSFSEMVPFYINDLGFTLELRSTSNFKTIGLLQPWQTLCKMFSRCLTTRVSGFSLLFKESNNLDSLSYIHKDYRKSKGIAGMKIPDWMITDKMKLKENYRLYAEVFGLDVPTTQLTPPTPIPTTHEAVDLTLQDTLQVSLVEQKSHEELDATQNVEKVKEHLIAKDIKKLVEGSENVEENVAVTSSPFRNDDNQVDLDTRLEPRSDKESRKVEKIADISQPVNVIEEEEESVEDDYELRRREKGKYVEDIRNTPSPITIRSSKIQTNLVSSDTERLQELTKIDTLPSSSTPSSSSPKSKLSATTLLLSLFKVKPGHFRRYNSFFQELQGRYGYLFEHLSAKFMPRRKFNELAKNLEDIMMEALPKLVDDRIKVLLKKQVQLYVAEGLILEREKSQEDVAKMIAEAIQQECENLRLEVSSQVNDAIANHIPSQVDSSVRSYMSDHILHVHSAKDSHPSTQEQQYKLYLTMKDDPQLQKNDVSICLALKIKFKRLQVATTPCRPSVVRPRGQDDPHDDAHPEGENSAKRQRISEHGTFDIRGSSFSQYYDGEPGLTTSDSSVLQMQNFLKSDIVWESRIEIIVPPYRPKPTPVVQNYQRDPKAPRIPLVNQDLLYLKKGNSGPDTIVLSLHMFLTVIFPDDDIEERTSRWVEKYIFARRANGSIVSITESDYKNLNKNDIEDMYLLIVNHKVDDYAEVGLLWPLSVFIRSAVIWERFHDFQLGVESYQQQVNLTAPIITFPGIEKYKMFSIFFEPVYGIIYENSKKEKRVMRHHEVHKFCDAILKRVLEGLKSYNNDVKYGYVTHNLSKEDVEYLQLFTEEIEEWLKIIRNAIKDVMPDVLNTLILKPMYKEFNALNKIKSSRFDSLETRIHQTIRKHVRVKMSKIDRPLRQLETKVDKT